MMMDNIKWKKYYFGDVGKNGLFGETFKRRKRVLTGENNDGVHQSIPSKFHSHPYPGKK
jgi:hypothetical protein